MVKANNSHFGIFFYNDIRNSVGCFKILTQSGRVKYGIIIDARGSIGYKGDVGVVGLMLLTQFISHQQRWPRPLPGAILIPPTLLVVADFNSNLDEPELKR